MTSNRPWRSLKKAERLLAPGLVLLLVCLPAPVQGARNPHVFMEDPARCLQCHGEEPPDPGGSFKKDIVTLCRECHSVVHQMSHPVDIRPGGDVQALLPLDQEGTITCATCHDPHSEPFSAEPYVSRSLVERLKGLFSSDGFLTYFLRMPNTQGQLCLSCHSGGEVDRGYLDVPTVFERDFTGSRVCGRCHGEVYQAWRRTPHARTLRDPRESPDAVEAAFTGEEGFRADEVEYVIGVHWTQRYVVDRAGELRVARGVWSLAESRWTRSFWREQLWKDYCAGCHLTGYDPYRDTYVEKGVGCEMCHGPGGEHARSGKKEAIVNPASLSWRQSSSVCASCHTNGHDRTGQFRYPVGYLPGEDLGTYYRGLLPHVGQGADTFKGDGTFEDRLRSFAYWMDRFYSPSRILCKQCKSLHIQFADGEEDRGTLTIAQYCLSCHEEIHRDPEHRFMESGEVGCPSCHEPLKDRLGRPSIHDHKFEFVR